MSVQSREGARWKRKRSRRPFCVYMYPAHFHVHLYVVSVFHFIVGRNDVPFILLCVPGMSRGVSRFCWRRRWFLFHPLRFDCQVPAQNSVFLCDFGCHSRRSFRARPLRRMPDNVYQKDALGVSDACRCYRASCVGSSWACLRDFGFQFVT